MAAERRGIAVSAVPRAVDATNVPVVTRAWVRGTDILGRSTVGSVRRIYDARLRDVRSRKGLEDVRIHRHPFVYYMNDVHVKYIDARHLLLGFFCASWLPTPEYPRFLSFAVA